MGRSKKKVVICALILMSPFFATIAKDTLLITSDKTAQINKSKGLLLLKENVVIVQQSNQSTLKTDELLVTRDATSDQVLRAVADGSVEFKYRPATANPKSSIHKNLTSTNENKFINSTCDWASFDRPKELIELRGSVVVKSVDYILEADHVKYYYKSENGRFTALPGEQVIMTYFRNSDKNTSKSATTFNRTKTRATADLILFNKSSRKVTLQGNVHIEDFEDQSQISANRAELFFDINDTLEQMIANGKFVMSQPKRLSKADRAVFDYQKEEVTLTGNAYVKEEEKIEITSSLIIMHIKAEKGIIKGAEQIPVKMKVTID